MRAGCEKGVSSAGMRDVSCRSYTRKIWIWVGVVASGFASLGFAGAQTISYTGTLASPEDLFDTTVNLNAGDVVTLQTYGFGGGVNGDGTMVAPGGFDAFVGLFSGTGDTATFVNGNSDVLTNFSPGCPPAGTVTVGSVDGQCGDVNLQIDGLSAGTYTVLLTDGANIPAAVFEDIGTLGDGFIDLTGGEFQTCVDVNNCNTDNGNWALDVTVGSGSAAPTPEPVSVELVGTAALLAVGWMYRKERYFLSKSARGES